MRFLTVIASFVMFVLMATSNFSYAATFPEGDINLALRQAVHQMLSSQGDSTSYIEPVEYLGGGDFRIRVDSGFDYSVFPGALKKALSDFNVHDPYSVKVNSCETGLLILGYNHVALDSNDVACRERDEAPSCAELHLKFDISPEKSQKSLAFLLWLVIPAAGIGGIFWFRKKTKDEDPGFEESSGRFQLGSFQFDHPKQTLTKGEEVISLTYRESKLLAYFAERVNKVLAREEIQSAVWGDEGIIVGRSLDVFVSRLRKTLSSDAGVSIKTIHGVGYRLEVAE